MFRKAQKRVLGLLKMVIGIDFDNTIACYEALFHKVALEQGVIDDTVAVNKVAVRDHLRNSGQEPVWTALQGVVYGKRMDEASAFSGVVAFIAAAQVRGDELYIISHKTRHPVIGPRYDLHAAARQWIEQNLVQDGEQLLPPEQIFFKPTREEKLAQIDECGCDLFIDDLPEVLTAPGFPRKAEAILFDPEGHYHSPGIATFANWGEILDHLSAVIGSSR